jgi:hypothetical protein
MLCAHSAELRVCGCGGRAQSACMGEPRRAALAPAGSRPPCWPRPSAASPLPTGKAQAQCRCRARRVQCGSGRLLLRRSPAGAARPRRHLPRRRVSGRGARCNAVRASKTWLRDGGALLLRRCMLRSHRRRRTRAAAAASASAASPCPSPHAAPPAALKKTQRPWQGAPAVPPARPLSRFPTPPSPPRPRLPAHPSSPQPLRHPHGHARALCASPSTTSASHSPASHSFRLASRLLSPRTHCIPFPDLPH